MDREQGRLNLDELADLAGVSRRTIRYYVQEGLLPQPLGVGRGSHYDRSHLQRLLEVKAQQEAGLSLDAIRSRRAAPSGDAVPAPPLPQPLPRSVWRRLLIAPGVELHVAHDVKLPASGRLEELVEWCAQHLSRSAKDED